MPDCAYCGSADVEITTTTFEEREGDLLIRVEGVPAIQCRVCKEGSEPAVALGVAKALQAAYELIFDAASASRPILASAVNTEAARKAV
jgi:YgiT-type zinc finger domain-containing protein